MGTHNASHASESFRHGLQPHCHRAFGRGSLDGDDAHGGMAVQVGLGRSYGTIPWRLLDSFANPSCLPILPLSIDTSCFGSCQPSMISVHFLFILVSDSLGELPGIIAHVDGGYCRLQ